ncbi:DUF368 domain-containing protein [Petrotoga sp. 9PWA.NaAc.5.4]|uniref:DUF368 domain-containing protein n=1 Tax=Petrotoga sp. 9PWA.NaAc.5.4 TaxID=1434328 RepID=UPI000CC28839|nr:DUF368 domain-containing protein [Petrotoga sp. 9PWA.NaAc.5.4]PNR94601.1 membrane protein [Petrotoga sp. 9PWA.NaAc.5.4]
MNLQKFIVFIDGILMGIADSIPGISGATIALIVGIYEKFISSWSYFFSNISHLKKLIKSKEFRFLLILYIGVFVGLFASLNVIGFLMTNYENGVFSFFTGLIIASIFFLFGEISKKEKHEVSQNKTILFIFSSVLGFLLAFYISGLKTLTVDHSLPVILLSGFFAICAMVLPGISGSFVLLMMNQYDYIVKAVNELNFIVLMVFVLGAILGIAVMSKFLQWLLKKFYAFTMYFLIGLMVGGLRAPLSRIDNLTVLIIFGLIGVLFVVLLERLGRKSRNT